MQVRHALFPLAAALAIGLAPQSGWAQDGTAYEFKCDPGFALVGIEGWQGEWMDGVRGLCSAVNVGTGAVSDIVRRTSAAGTVKTNTQRYRCPANMVMTGFTSSKANYVLSIYSLSCRRIQPGGMAATQITFRDAFPKRTGNILTGTGRWVADECSSGRVATHIRGREGTYLDSFGVYCFLLPSATVAAAPTATTPPPTSRTGTITRTPPPPATVTLLGPANGTQIKGRPADAGCYDTDNFPPFSWAAAANASRYDFELRNVTLGRRLGGQTEARSFSVGATYRRAPAAGSSYSWRVRGVNALGVAGPWSAARSFSAIAAERLEGTCVMSGAGYTTF